ncbi:potassium transporter Kup [Ochrobactrum soli]|uniref:Probable potassium transport system protein Kup n=2 Tax=Ochrobactrum TaxID=528 RepID=A0ABY2Y7D9_9HYPH|nr:MULTISPECIES: potassium transporter Kup [Brucella]NNU61314.1 potassium transporter Kup [[Ochrobactrum] soli]TNV17524.1 potassium transporter Kup [[Ochrobactrum] teleogrylli]
MSDELNGQNAQSQSSAPDAAVTPLVGGVGAETGYIGEENDHHSDSMKTLVLGALGVVYGDIGTSPIYAFREALHTAASDGVLSRPDILGVVSLIFWALTLVVTIKYVLFVLRADNNGEGGILSLMALVRGALKGRPNLILAVGICGAALFFGDAVITPAISVLSAMEGLEIVAPSLTPFVVPITVVILVTLFSVQKLGTGKVAIVFGPIMAIWFLALGASGLWHIFDDPTVIYALNPYYAVRFLAISPGIAFITVGAVFLAMTGAEALYADLGHFGRKPIVRAWLWIVFPCLVLNYFGQAAFILSHGEAAALPFFQMLPNFALLPMVLLATAATVIASQAVITGAFSVARQAVQLNILPRLEIQHTSEKLHGQIYIPRVNLLLGLTVVILVLGFEKSTNLAAAYGIAVTGNMLVTTVLLYIVMTRIWNWQVSRALPLMLGFLLIDIMFFSANIIKVHEGGWASIGIAAVLVLIMWTWVRGTRHLFLKTRKGEVPLDLIVEQMAKRPPTIVPGTAVFLTGDPKSAPTALMHSLKHYKVLHQNNVILTVVTASKPWVSSADRARVSQYNERFMQVTLKFGYMQQPNIPRALGLCRKLGWKFDIMTTSFFLSRRSLKASVHSGMPLWQDKLFILLARTASDATEYFQIPTGRVVEIGTQVNI